MTTSVWSQPYDVKLLPKIAYPDIVNYLVFSPRISHSVFIFLNRTTTYHNHFVPYADPYIITISYHMQIDTLLQFRTICRSTHYDHFVPYAKSYEDSTFILILHHIQINVIPSRSAYGTKWS
jgi:hypothetical protein